MTNRPRSATGRRPSDASSRLLSFLERASARIAPRATKVLAVFVMIAAVKLGVLLFLGLDMFLPDPPARVASVAAPQPLSPAASALANLPVAGPVPALAQQQAPAAPAAPAAPTTPAAATTPDAQALQKRQEQLDQREQALNTLQTNLNARVERLKEMEASIKKLLEEAKSVKDAKLKHLIDVYSNMNAKQAAKVMETLDNNIAVKILAGMRGRQAGDVLNNMEAKKAAGLTEMLTKLQLPPSDNAAPGAGGQ